MKEITPKTSNSAGDNGSKPESDDPSDQCDFGYVLVNRGRSTAELRAEAEEILKAKQTTEVTPRN